MTDLDLEHLGDVWRQQPDPAELERLRRTAETVRRRARWSQAVDAVAALVVAGVVLLLVAGNPELDTMIVGGAAILVLLAGHIRSRRLRQEELRSLSGSAEQMLDQSVARLKAKIKRTRYQLLCLLPGFGIGIAIAYFADEGAGQQVFNRLLANTREAGLLFVGGLIAVAAMFLYLLRNLRTERKELDRLTALRRSYDEEDPVSG
jgi:hypothetical protein